MRALKGLSMKLLVLACVFLSMLHVAVASPITSNPYQPIVGEMIKHDKNANKHDPLANATPIGPWTVVSQKPIDNPTNAPASTFVPPEARHSGNILPYILIPLILALILAIAFYVYRFIRTKLTRPDTRNKRIALLAFPFFFIPSLVLLNKELMSNYYGTLFWKPSVTWAILSTASALCLIFAFSNLDKWIEGGNNKEIKRKSE